VPGCVRRSGNCRLQLIEHPLASMGSVVSTPRETMRTRASERVGTVRSAPTLFETGEAPGPQFQRFYRCPREIQGWRASLPPRPRRHRQEHLTADPVELRRPVAEACALGLLEISTSTSSASSLRPLGRTRWRAYRRNGKSLACRWPSAPQSLPHERGPARPRLSRQTHPACPSPVTGRPLLAERHHLFRVPADDRHIPPIAVDHELDIHRVCHAPGMHQRPRPGHGSRIASSEPSGNPSSHSARPSRQGAHFRIVRRGARCARGSCPVRRGRAPWPRAHSRPRAARDGTGSPTGNGACSRSPGSPSRLATAARL
jgi:hypothetical protein